MNDRSWIVDRVGAPALNLLTRELAGCDLQSLLLEVMHQRASRRKPSDVLSQYQRDGFCAPGAVDLRTSMAIDSHLLAAAKDFEAIDLSPAAPLGCCSTVAATDQNRVLSALRNTEVVSDPTNVLALECARRLRADPRAAVHLATSQRVVRTQPVPKLPGYTQHFRIFVVASGGRESKDHGFTIETIQRHIRTMLAGLERLEEHGYSFGNRGVDIFATPEREGIADRVAASLGGTVARKRLEHPYYSGGIRFQIWVTAPDGAAIPLVDGGAFDWLARIASNRRAVFIATGAGAQLIAIQFCKS
jgi:hypothetical protein